MAPFMIGRDVAFLNAQPYGKNDAADQGIATMMGPYFLFTLTSIPWRRSDRWKPTAENVERAGQKTLSIT